MTPMRGVVAILLVMLIYAVNFVATRYSVLNGLSPLDLTALRYAVAGVLLLPYLFRLGPTDLGGIGWRKGIILTCLGGAPYVFVFLKGLTYAPASHGAVLNPGIVPSVVFLGMVFLGRQPFSRTKALSLILIVAGLVLVTGSSFTTQGHVLFGDVLLFTTGICWGLFTLLLKVWDLKPMQAAAVVAVISLAYLPPYVAFSYHGMGSASLTHVVAQAVFQGIVISIGSLYLVTYAVQRLGAQLTALFSPLVPVVTTMLAARLLKENPTALQWWGVVIVGVGMVSAGISDAPPDGHRKLGSGPWAPG